MQIKVGEGLYAFGASPEGGLAIEGLPAGSPLPSVLPKGSYETSVSGVIPTFKSIFYLALSLIIMGGRLSQGQHLLDRRPALRGE
ncbi:MAG: hypothetical protein WDN76_10310 [Alphaproteobacteria bacterium]